MELSFKFYHAVKGIWKKYSNILFHVQLKNHATFGKICTCIFCLTARLNLKSNSILFIGYSANKTRYAHGLNNFSRVWTVERSWGVDPLRRISVRERTTGGDHVIRKPREIGAILRDVVNWIKSWWRGSYPWFRRTGTLYSMDWINSFHPSTEWRIRYMRNHVLFDYISFVW